MAHRLPERLGVTVVVATAIRAVTLVALVEVMLVEGASAEAAPKGESGELRVVEASRPMPR